VVKKTPLSDFANVRTNGIRAVELDEGDGLVNVTLTDGSRDIMLFGSHGKAVRFAEDEVRPMGRTARGVIGMRFSDEAADARVVAMLMVDGDGDVLIATSRGYGKRTAVTEFPQKGRGTQGVIAIQTSERNGPLVGAVQLTDAHDVMLISDQGTLVRTRAAEISQVGRNTQGVTLIRLPDDEKLVGLERLDALPEDDSERADPAAPVAGDTPEPPPG
jgi:DNA gyrase subunit A